MDETDEIRWREITTEERGRLPSAAASVFAARPWVVAAWHYGSSTNEGTRARDVDVGILATQRPERLAVTDHLASELHEASGIDGVPFDLRLVDGADPVFLGRFLASAVLIYESDRRARIEWEARAMAQWLDYRPVWERMRRGALGAWAHG